MPNLHDFRSALRGLIRDRTFTIFSILALALGLGLNGSLLVLSRTFLLRSAPVADPDSLLEIRDISRKKAGGDATGSASAFEAIAEMPEVSLAGRLDSPSTRSWIRHGVLEPLQVASASHGYLATCGLHPFLGRNFAPEETGLVKPPALAIVSHRLWKTRLGGRPEVLGSLLNLDGKEHTVVGILPPGFEGSQFSRSADLLVPCQDWGLSPSKPIRSWSQVLVRLRPGITRAQFQARLDSLPWHPDWRLEVAPYQPMPPVLRGKLARALGGLHAASLLVLAVGIANVLALQTARLHRRRPELALRAALGASGGSLFRLILVEHLILAGLSGIAALGLAMGSSRFLEALQAILPFPPKVHTSFGLWPAAVTMGLALLLGGLLAGLVHLQIRRMDLGGPLKETGSHATGTRTRSLLVGLQAALALVLLSSTALCLKDLRRQLAIPLGFSMQGRYLVELHPSKIGRKDAELAPRLDPALARLKALPGVTRIALGRGFPLGANGQLVQEKDARSFYLTGTAEALDLLGVRPIQGRALEAGDEDRGRVLVSAGYAATRWPGESPLGKRWDFNHGEMEVVGVVPDLRISGPTDGPKPLVFVPTQRTSPLTAQPHNSFLIQAEGPDRALRAEINSALRAEFQDIPFTLESLEARRDTDLAQPRQLLFLSAVMGTLALALSLCGLYGLSAHLAEARKREFGIRIVLGAGPGRILAALAADSLLPLVPGLAAGAALSIAASRLLVSQKAEFAGIDSMILLPASLALAIAAALATLLPALRAARQQPAEALRNE